jgi:hypothetical protein
MKTTTITIPNDLDAELDELARERSGTTDEVVETALRQYLVDAQRWGGREYRPGTKPFEITPLIEKDGLESPTSVSTTIATSLRNERRSR